MSPLSPKKRKSLSVRTGLNLLILAACLPVMTARLQAATFQNPLNTVNGSDPYMTYYNCNYYLTSTQWNSIKMFKSPTIAGLKTAPANTIWQDTTASRCCNVWAPEFHFLNGPDGMRWYVYYTAGATGSNYTANQFTHVLESAGTDPLGPYTYKARVFDPAHDTGQLDASVFELNGTLYFIGSDWESTQHLFIAPMSNPWTLSGNRVALSTPTQPWETMGAPVQEGPIALQHGGNTYIIYSASYCPTQYYCLGMLTYNGGNPLSAASWTKSTGPVFQESAANGVYGPGHNGFFLSPDGTEDWIVYHANSSVTGGCDGGRTTRVQKFTWNADGTPNFGIPLPLSAVITVPSGDGACSSPIPTPTPTSTNTPTMTRTNTLTPTPSSTATRTPTSTNTAMPTNTFTGTPTYTPANSATSTGTSTPTSTSSATPTRTNTASNTATYSSTPTSTDTFTMTSTNTATLTYTRTSTPTNSSTPTITNTPTNSSTSTALPTSTPTVSFTFTNTITSTSTSTQTFTSTNTATLTPTATSTYTNTASSTPTITGTFTYSPTGTTPPTNTPTLNSTFTNTITSTSTSTRTSTSTNATTSTATFTTTNTWTLTSTPTSTRTNTPTNTVTNTSSATSTATHTSSATPTSTATFSSTSTPTFTSTATPTPTNTYTLTYTSTQTFSFTPTHTGTPSLTATPTPVGNKVVVIYPNPAPGGTVNVLPPAYTGTSNVRIEIFTVAFRKVQDKTFANVPSGTAVTITLTDRWGTALASGVYYFIVTTSRGKSIGKSMILN